MTNIFNACKITQKCGSQARKDETEANRYTAPSQKLIRGSPHSPKHKHSREKFWGGFVFGEFTEVDLLVLFYIFMIIFVLLQINQSVDIPQLDYTEYY